MNYRIINKTEDYIEAHLHQKITLQELADNIHLSPFHFHRLFKKHSKENLYEFILRFKLERSAIFMIVNPQLTVTEIAYLYGFNDSSSYSRAFKRHYHMSPKNYRKEQDMSRQPLKELP